MLRDFTKVRSSSVVLQQCHSRTSCNSICVLGKQIPLRMIIRCYVAEGACLVSHSGSSYLFISDKYDTIVQIPFSIGEVTVCHNFERHQTRWTKYPLSKTRKGWLEMLVALYGRPELKIIICVAFVLEIPVNGPCNLRPVCPISWANQI